MRPTSALIVTPPETGCQENAAMKAPVVDAAGMDASPTGAACDARASIIVLSVTQGRQLRGRFTAGSRFNVDSVSNGRFAKCDGLQIGREVRPV